MSDLRPERTEARLTLLIYMDGLSGILTSQRKVIALENWSMVRSDGAASEVQVALDQFYSSNDKFRQELDSIELIFVNSIFHRTGKGRLEAFKNRLPAYLLYHREFFEAPVSNIHIAQKLQAVLAEYQTREPDQPVLWFHLRKNILYVMFGTPDGADSINSFEVHKALDVYYYILFNYQTLQPIVPGLDHVVISGELVNLEGVYNFFEDNLPDTALKTYWQWQRLPGKPAIELHPLLPEVNI